MSEFEQSANQSAETEVNEPSIQQEQTEQPTSPQESNYFTVKYNKEERQVSYDEAPDYIQKGLNYEKVQQRATEYEQHLNRVAQLSGYQTHDEFISALEEAEKQQERQRYEEAGIDPDLFNQLLEDHPLMQQAKEIQAREQQQQQYEQELMQLFDKFPDLQTQDLKELHQYSRENNMPLLFAHYEMSFPKIAQQKEQEAIQKLQNNVQSSPGSLSSGDVPHTKSVKSLSSQDFNSLVNQVLRGERKQL